MTYAIEIVCSVFLVVGCSLGPDNATDATGTGDGTSTAGGTTGPDGTSTGATTPTTGGLTDASTTGTTGSTGETTSDATSETTGALACEAIVGSTDCVALAEVSPDLSLEECMKCQGTACGAEAICDAQYPCVDGAIVLRGCCTDDQCDDLIPFCGMFLGTNNICVKHDDQ